MSTRFVPERYRFQDYPEPHAKHMAMLYLRSTVQPKSTTTVTHTKAQVRRLRAGELLRRGHRRIHSVVFVSMGFLPW